MKNYFYFALLITLFFSSCKSNSFLNQRYTHLGHSPNKSHATKAIDKQQAVATDIQTASLPAQDRKDIDNQVEAKVDFKASEETIAAEVKNEAKNPSSSLRGNEKTSSEIENGFNSFKIKNIADSVKLSAESMATTFHKKVSESKRGLIFGLINLALFIVICVVVVVGVVFLIALI